MTKPVIKVNYPTSINSVSINKKHINLTLIALVSIVWAFVGMTAIDFDDKKLPLDHSVITKSHNQLTLRPRYNPHYDYSNPFGEFERIKAHNEFKPSNKHTQDNRNQPLKRSTKPELKWPLIRYFGVIENVENDKALGLIKVDSSSHIITAGSVVNDLVIVSMKADSITMKLVNEVKSIKSSNTY